MADVKTKFLELTRMPYIDQAKWFLNGFWKEEAQSEAENIWNFANKFIELDTKKKQGNELDEFSSHKFLESLGETLTVIQLREKLRQIDLDANGKMALLEYLSFKYSKAVKQVVDSPQGDNQKEVNEAQAKLQAVQDALVEVQSQLASLQKAEEEVKTALANQKRAEEALQKSEAELRAAIDDLKRQEDSYANQLQTLEKKANDPSGSTVAKSKAAAELAQLKGENPLPLRKAKITQEAALRKVEKERKAAQAALAELQAKTAEAEQKTKSVEAAVKETEARFQEAQDFLEEVKNKGGASLGALWWMERELKEAQKYLPKKKQQN